MMNQKIALLLGILVLVGSCSSSTYFTPETTASSIYSPVYNAANDKASVEPAPIYEESKDIRGDSGSHNIFKSHDAINPALTNFQAHVSSVAHLSDHDQIITAPSDYRPYTFASPLAVSRVPIPVTYTSHIHSVPFETHTSQLITKTAGSWHNSRTPIQQNEAIKTTITYAEAPEVSHATFTGYGTSYSW